MCCSYVAVIASKFAFRLVPQLSFPTRVRIGDRCFVTDGMIVDCHSTFPGNFLVVLDSRLNEEPEGTDERNYFCAFDERRIRSDVVHVKRSFCQ